MHGIDYGRGQTNIDHATGIRFGVIPQHDCLQAWCDLSEAVYPCEQCNAWNKADEYCMEEDAMCDPSHFAYAQNGYDMVCGDDGDIFIMKSPYFTYANLCSPCAPGACHLREPIEMTQDEVSHALTTHKFPLSNPSEFDANKCYCLGHEWFYDQEIEHAPYPVYDIETGARVYPPGQEPTITNGVSWRVSVSHMTDSSDDVRVDINGQPHFLNLEPVVGNAEDIVQFVREILQIALESTNK